MSIEEPMNVDERRKYLHTMQAVTGLHRKSLLRLIHGELARKPRRRRRGKSYGAEVQAVPRAWISPVLNGCFPIWSGWPNT